MLRRFKPNVLWVDTGVYSRCPLIKLRCPKLFSWLMFARSVTLSWKMGMITLNVIKSFLIFLNLSTRHFNQLKINIVWNSPKKTRKQAQKKITQRTDKTGMTWYKYQHQNTANCGLKIWFFLLIKYNNCWFYPVTILSGSVSSLGCPERGSISWTQSSSTFHVRSPGKFVQWSFLS